MPRKRLQKLELVPAEGLPQRAASNLSKVDQLVALREEIKALGKLEKDLRDHLLEHPEDRQGQFNEAYLDTRTSASVDADKLRRIAPAVFAEVARWRDVKILRTRKIRE